MKKLSHRLARLTPSLTAGLILFTVALTGLLAWRALDASRSQQQTVERTLRDYAGFAAFQLKNASLNRITGQGRGAFEYVVQAINARGPKPPLGADSAARLIAARGPVCRCLEGVSFFYQVNFADRTLEATASAVATSQNLQQLRDTVLAQPGGPARNDPALPALASTRAIGVPITSQYLVTIFANLGDRPYVFTHAVTLDTAGAPVIAYGFAVPADVVISRTVRLVLSSQPVLPSTLTRGLHIDSLLAVTVSTRSGEVIYASDALMDNRFAAIDSVEARVGGLRFQVAINPAAAGTLIIGGLPESRLPEVLATALVAVILLVLLLFQFRRQAELGRLRDEFVSGVSHELRTPLAQIRLLAELLRLGKVPTEERKERSLRIIDQEARRLSFLVDSILSFNNADGARLAPVSTDVAAEIEEIISGFEPLAEAQGVRISTQLERDIVADVDRGALRQVLLNLLDNAVRYGPPRQNVCVTTKLDSDTWRLEVTDEGPGIPVNERERIFAPYYRMQRDAGGAVGGTGIGLAVVRRLVEAHDGRVHVVSHNEIQNNNHAGNGPSNETGNGVGNFTTGARFVVVFPIAAPREH